MWNTAKATRGARRSGGPRRPGSDPFITITTLEEAGIIIPGSYGWVDHISNAFYTKSPRRPCQVPGQFPNRLEVIHKNVFDWFYK
jgi:hypothetical protein